MDSERVAEFEKNFNFYMCNYQREKLVDVMFAEMAWFKFWLILKNWWRIHVYFATWRIGNLVIDCQLAECKISQKFSPVPYFVFFIMGEQPAKLWSSVYRHLSASPTCIP